jgi:hypothetical protein
VVQMTFPGTQRRFFLSLNSRQRPLTLTKARGAPRHFTRFRALFLCIF